MNTRMTNVSPGRAPRLTNWADAAGVLGAVTAALCCAGTPIIVAVLTAVGLGWFRQDAILWPLMFVSLAIALWGFSRDRRRHARLGPLATASVGAAALVAGVVFVHGPPAMSLIYSGACLLIGATLWNIWLRREASTLSS